MAEQISHDVVNQTRSGGEPSPSDVPASKPDKESAGGDVGGRSDNAVTQGNSAPVGQHPDEKNSASVSPTDMYENDKLPDSQATVSISKGLAFDEQH
jgi:hypothetical protein